MKGKKMKIKTEMDYLIDAMPIAKEIGASVEAGDGYVALWINGDKVICSNAHEAIGWCRGYAQGRKDSLVTKNDSHM
jgi:hypothetical protein